MGCSVDAPVHCSDGSCAVSIASCAGNSNCNTTAPFRCADFSCVADQTTCPQPYRTYTATEMSVLVNVLEEKNIEFAFSASGAAIARVFFPSGSIRNTSSSSFQRTITVTPVAESELRLVKNTVPDSYNNYVRQRYLMSGGSVPFEYSVLSSVARIATDAAGGEELLASAATLEFSVNVPGVLTPANDVCLGQFNVTGEDWSCVDRSFAVTTDGKYQFYVTQLGAVYAVLFNPNPDTYEAADCTTWLCKNNILLFGLLIALVTIAAFFSIFVWRACVVSRHEEDTLKEIEARQRELLYAQRPQESEAPDLTAVTDRGLVDTMMGMEL